MGKRTILNDFGAETSFHGIGHALASGSNFGKIFWTLVFITGAVMACFQSAKTVYNYVTNEDNEVTTEVEVDPRTLADEHFFKICPVNWLDKSKIQTAVGKGKFSYRNLLFALSTIPNLNRRLLDQMSLWDEIPDEDRIWGLRKRACPDRTLGSAEIAEISADLASGKRLSSPQIDKVVAGAETTCQDNCLTNTWRNESLAFQSATKGKYATLTDFFASVANEFNPFLSAGAERVKWKMSNGQLCQVIKVNSKKFDSRNSIITEVTLASNLRALLENENMGNVVGSKLITASSYSAESSYDVDDSQSRVDVEATVLQNLLGGVSTEIQILVPELRKITKKLLCRSVGDYSEPKVQGFESIEIKMKCRKNHELIKVSPSSANMVESGPLPEFKLITESDLGDISLDQALAPVELFQIEYAKEVEECSNKFSTSFCEEWKASTIVNVRAATPTSGCQKNRSVTLQYELRTVKGVHVKNLGIVDPTEIIGTVGGLLGLYLGSSLITLLHTVVFFCNRAVVYIRGRQLKGTSTMD